MTKKQRRKIWFEANREHCRQYGKAWRSANLERCRTMEAASARRRKAANREGYLQKRAATYHKNKEHYHQYAADWRKKNKEKCRQYAAGSRKRNAERRKAYAREGGNRLSDCYVAWQLGMPLRKLPREIVEAKRAQLMLVRLLRRKP